MRLPPLATIGFLLIISGGPVAAFIPQEREIPSDESDAREMLAAGTLDSALWQQLRPLYRRPLDVPSGELAQLYDPFPDLEGYAPVTQAELDRYLPWDKRSIDLFFSDYPLLARFRPVLRFNRRSADGRTGAAGFHLCRLSDDTAATHTVSAALSPVERLRFQGAAEMTSDYARWERRTLTIDPIAAIRVDVGNGIFFSDRGLFYGAFTPYRPDAGDVKSNWLYGETSTWNGLAVRGSLPVEKGPCRPQFSCFLHDRPAELIAGCNAGVALRKKLSVFLGASRMSLATTDAASIYMHGSMKLRLPDFSSDLDCGFETGKKIAVPFSWRSTLRRGDNSVELLMVSLPQMYQAPLSQLRSSFIREMEYGDTMRSSVTFVRFSSETGTDRPFRWVPQVELWFEKLNVHHGAIEVMAETVFDRFEGSLLFSREFGFGEDGTYPTMLSGTIEGKFSPVFSLNALQRFSVGRTAASSSYRCRLSPAVVLFGCNRIEPYVAFAAKRRTVSAASLGLMQRTTLFDRTYTEFIFEKDIVVRKTEGLLRVEGRISFYF